MGSAWKQNDYYEILEVAKDASPQEIHEAFRRAKTTYSQDNPALYGMFTKQETSELLKIIDEAYEVLGNHRLRQAYDLQLAGKTEELRWREHPVVEDSIPELPRVKLRAVPSQAGQTQFGNYESNAEMESAIENAEVFDGALLQKIRVYKNINLQNLSDATRISRTYLTAVENMDLKTLPAPVFVRGFVVQLARALNLDEKRVVESYMKSLRDRMSSP